MLLHLVDANIIRTLAILTVNCNKSAEFNACYFFFIQGKDAKKRFPPGFKYVLKFVNVP